MFARNEAAAQFLINNNCDVITQISLQRGGGDEEEAGRMCSSTPLHLAAQLNLCAVMACLLQRVEFSSCDAISSADSSSSSASRFEMVARNLNALDGEGRTALHVAIQNGHNEICRALLFCPNTSNDAISNHSNTPRNRRGGGGGGVGEWVGAQKRPGLDVNTKNQLGQTAFHTAMECSNKHAASAILEVAPDAANEVDNCGRNFLHVALQTGNQEAVFFLLQIGVNVNQRMQDPIKKHAPLHIAVIYGVPDNIVRSLIMAQADVNAVTLQLQTCLHLCVCFGRAQLISAFLENGIDAKALDNNRNTALHLAMRTEDPQLLRELALPLLDDYARIDPLLTNLKGENALHVLAKCAPIEDCVALDVLARLLRNHPDFPVDRPDINGDTPFLLAFSHGNKRLCIALLQSGAVSLGHANQSNVSIFNLPKSSNQLLHAVLDSIETKPDWTNGETCLQCFQSFTMTNRKHHCRHCGRLVCDACSENKVPILKYNSKKAERVCEPCFIYITEPATF